MSLTLSLSWHSFALEKQGHEAAEYEDAFAADPGRGRFAVADGASESSFAFEWARLLCEAFVREPPQRGSWDAWLAPVRDQWRHAVGSAELPWYAEQKRADGASATLVGLEIRGEVHKTGFPWRAVAVGDACLFQVRDGTLRRWFPVERAADFGTRPELLNSSDTGGIPAHDQYLIGHAHPGDRFLLASDALARWFLEEVERGGRPWEVLAGLTAEAFPVWVHHLRAERALRNDDATLVSIEVAAQDAGP